MALSATLGFLIDDALSPFFKPITAGILGLLASSVVFYVTRNFLKNLRGG